jgi:hypothetical protein
MRWRGLAPAFAGNPRDSLAEWCMISRNSRSPGRHNIRAFCAEFYVNRAFAPNLISDSLIEFAFVIITASLC